MTRWLRFVVLGGLGAALLTRPRDVVRTLCGGSAEPPETVLRVLGARQVAQEVVLLAKPSPAVLTGAAGTDLLHAASMAAAALVWAQYRRPALTSGAIAASSAAAALSRARR
jgi:hypothetical protein